MFFPARIEKIDFSLAQDHVSGISNGISPSMQTQPRPGPRLGYLERDLTLDADWLAPPVGPLLIAQAIGTGEDHGVALDVLRLELAAPDHGELLVVDARQELDRGLVGRVALGELATYGEVDSPPSRSTVSTRERQRSSSATMRPCSASGGTGRRVVRKTFNETVFCAVPVAILSNQPEQAVEPT